MVRRFFRGLENSSAVWYGHTFWDYKHREWTVDPHPPWLWGDFDPPEISKAQAQARITKNGTYPEEWVDPTEPHFVSDRFVRHYFT